MCKPDSAIELAISRASGPPSFESGPAQGSRRRRLWELPNRVSELLRRELERHYALVLRQFAAVKTTESLAVHCPLYRELVERHGGRFAHHDGGIEDSTHRLGASLAAADLVICQAGCLGHNAYGMVKDHCRRTGKRCVYLDRPSAASFARGLAQAAAQAAS